MITYGKLPNGKYMINWPIEGNDYYANIIEMTKEQRNEALKKAKNFTMCFLYFIQKELGYTTLGLADDEFPTEDKLPFIPYHRESRRIHGKVRFNLNHITNPYEQKDKLYRTNIAVGDYPVDHHHARYTGTEKLPNLYFHPVPSYGLPLGVMIPEDVDNLIVAEKSISVSNIVNGTTRLQPVVMQIGQAAGALAALSVKENKNTSEADVREVQNAILEAGGYLMPYLDVPVDDKRFKSYQRIGATGILKGEGRNVNWSNQTWLRADTVMLASEMKDIKEIYSSCGYEEVAGRDYVTLNEITELIKSISKTEKKELDMEKELSIISSEYGIDMNDPNRPVYRGELAILFDQLLDPFNSIRIDLRGNTK
jgi:hypothetical protein